MEKGVRSEYLGLPSKDVLKVVIGDAALQAGSGDRSHSSELWEQGR